MPEWASVWFWLRFVREPRVIAQLPQQPATPDSMTLAEYERYRDEWRRTGAPKASPALIVEAMTGNPILDV
jgi:hypothetical protein